MKKQVPGLCLIALSACANAHMTNYTCAVNNDPYHLVPMQTSMAQGVWGLQVDGKEIGIDTQYATPTKDDRGCEQYHNDVVGGGMVVVCSNTNNSKGFYIEYKKPEHEFTDVADTVYICNMTAGEY